MIAGRGFAYLASLVWTVLPRRSDPVLLPSDYHDRYIDACPAPAPRAHSPGRLSREWSVLLVARLFRLEGCRSAPVAGRGLRRGGSRLCNRRQALERDLPACSVHRALIVAPLRPRPDRRSRSASHRVADRLALWKYRGLGYPAADLGARAGLRALGRFADGAARRPRPPSVPLPLNWGQLQNNINYIREYAWSLRLLTWIMVTAGAIGLCAPIGRWSGV